ncbi:MAG: DMT family transporter [Candidatus Poseidoniales archaeon]
MSDISDRKVMSIALLGAVAISFAPIFYMFSEVNPVTGAFFRMLYALPLLFIIVIVFRKNDNRTKKTRLIAFSAGLLMAPDMLAYFSSMKFIGVGIATLIGNSQVIIVTIVSWKLFGEKPNPAILFSLPVVLFGLFLISGISDANAFGSNPIKGVIFGIAAAIFYSTFLVIFRFSNRELAPAANVQLDATLGAALGLLVLGFMPLSSISIAPIDFEFIWPGHGWIIILALTCQVAGWIAIAFALPRLPAAHTSFAVLLQPILSLIWGVILLSENPSIKQTIGIFLVLLSIMAVTVFGTVEDRKNTPSEIS